MKTRARMRRKSLTNSRPHLNEALRRQYLEEHPFCELMQLLDESCDPQWFQFMRDPPILTVEVHHIFTERMRPDYWWNFITLCRPAHDWCHARPTDGRIACICTNLICGNVNELEFKRVFGFHLHGWLWKSQGSTPFFERKRLECLEQIREAA